LQALITETRDLPGHQFPHCHAKPSTPPPYPGLFHWPNMTLQVLPRCHTKPCMQSIPPVSPPPPTTQPTYTHLLYWCYASH
jgi:hypothetical protein